jgi:hypothetical protein
MDAKLPFCGVFRTLEVEKNIFSFSPADYADLRGKLHESNSAMICDYQRDSIKFFSPADYEDLRRKLLKSILR